MRTRPGPSWWAGCYFWTPAHQSWRQLPMVECQAHTTIKGTSTRTRLQQSFTNVAESDIEKCQYAFPLYDGVSVVGFKCKIGEKVLEGVVKEREEAAKEFDEAVARGESAGLMEQNLQASDVFSTSLGNVPRMSTVVVTIEYVAELQHDLETDGWKFEMPTGIAPRYGEPNGQSRYRTIDYPCESNQLPPARDFEWTCDIQMPNAMTKVESPTHPVSVTLGQLSHEAEDCEPDFKKCSAKMTLHNESGLSKELILTVKAKGIKEPTALWETHPSLPSHTALMTTLVPNFALPLIKPEVVFVCDRSGSMRGEPIKTLIEALRVMLHSLPANSIKFNICSFGSDHSFLFAKSQSYSRTTLEEASRHLDSFDADYGGTETESALRATIENRYGDIPLEIILFTDGDIWTQQSLFSYLNEKVAESKQQIRLFPLGIGHGVSTSLIEGVARAGNGFASTVMPGERMDQRCMRMLKAALSPHISDYKLEVLYEREEEDEEDFEMVESVEEVTKVALRPKNAASTPTQSVTDSTGQKRKSISLFDTSVNADNTEMADVDTNLPAFSSPKILQAPFVIPPLYAFKRSTVYLLLGPDSAHRVPKSVILKGTLDGTELKLEIPVFKIGESNTIHQLAARKATQDLEEGRGWVFAAKTEDGRAIKEAHPSAWDDLLRKEAVRIGTTFQVMNRWCSFVARDAKTGHEQDAANASDDSVSSANLAPVSAGKASFRRASAPRSALPQNKSRGSVSGLPPRKQMASQAASWGLFGGISKSSNSSLFSHQGSMMLTPANPFSSYTSPDPVTSSAFKASGGLVQATGSTGFGGSFAPTGSATSATPAACAGPPARLLSSGSGGVRELLGGSKDRGGFGNNDNFATPSAQGTLFGMASHRASSFSDAMQECEDYVDSDEDMGLNIAHTLIQQFADNAAKVRALIQRQDFDGSWTASGNGGSNLKTLAMILGVPEAKLATAPAGVQLTDAATWSTVLAVVWLEEKMAAEKDVWEMSVEKAEAWLEEKGLAIRDLQGLKETAKEALK